MERFSALLYWTFVRGIHRSPVNSPHKGQWRGALMFSLICAWINGWVNNRKVGDLRRHRAHYGVIVMKIWLTQNNPLITTWFMACRFWKRTVCDNATSLTNSKLEIWITEARAKCLTLCTTHQKYEQIFIASFCGDDWRYELIHTLPQFLEYVCNKWITSHWSKYVITHTCP